MEFYQDENPGPLGKPSAPLISDNELRCGWDPTDPDRDNPWYSSVIYNHEAIASAIKMHIPELARTAMKDHINASLNYSSYTKNNILFG